MSFKINKVLLLFSAILIYSNSILAQQTRKPTSIKKEINVDQPDNSYISITNLSDTAAKFSIKLNDKLYSSVQEIKDEIYAMAGNNKDSSYYYAWKFIISTNYFSMSLLAENWTTTLLLFINSIGYGLCDKQAIVLNKLWKELGYKARLWGLNGHIVPEVYFNNKWHMMDPAYSIYYLNNNSEIASVQELSENPDLITKPRTILKDDYLKPIRYSKYLAELYKSKDDNKIVNEENSNEEISEFVFVLLPFSTLEFPGIYMSDPLTIGNTAVPNFSNCRIKIPPAQEGTLINTLVLADIKGNGIVYIDNIAYTIGDINLKNKISNHKSFIKEIIIGKHSDTIQIIYYLNPLLTSLQKNNKLIIKGENINLLAIKTSKLQKGQINNERLSKQYFFYDKARVDLMKKQIIMDTNYALINDPIRTIDGLITSFTNYCKFINLEKEETEKCQIKLRNVIGQNLSEFELALMFESISCIPREIVYYDIIQINEEQLSDLINRLKKTK